MRSKNKLVPLLIFALIWVLSFSPLFSGVVRSQEQPLIVATKSDYPPYSFLDEEGKATGYNVDLTEAIARTMQLSVEIRIGPCGEIRQALESGEIDAIAGMHFSVERDRRVDFTPPHTFVHHAIFVHRGSPSIETEEDLRGKDIIVMLGDIMHDYVLEKGLSDNPATVSTQADALSLLALGRHDCALIAKLPGFYWLNELGLSGIATTGPLLSPSRYCFAVQEGNSALRSTFAEGLAILSSNGGEKAIYDKWLGALKPHGIPRATVIKYIAAVGVPVLLLVAFLFCRSTRFKRQVVSHTRVLRERTKELQCMFAVAESIIKTETVEELLQDVVDLIPLGWQYPEITRVRIVFDDQVFFSVPFTVTDWRQSCDIIVGNERRGSLDVCYMEERPGLEEGPFLSAESSLINAASRLLSKAIEGKLAERQLRETRTQYRNLFQKMLNGFAVHEIICDKEGKAIDYRFLDVNPAFERMTGLKADLIIGNTVREVLPCVEARWIERYGEVALRGEPALFEDYSQELDKHFEVMAFSAGPNQFACCFADVSERRAFEKSLTNHRVRLQSLASRLADAEELLRQDIAAGLHDSIGQDLAALKLSVDMMRLNRGAGESWSGERSGKALDQISDGIDGIVKKIWALSFQLCPPGLYGTGFLPALEWLIEQFDSQYEIDFHLFVKQQPAEMSKQSRGILFHMIRELVINAIKHGQPTEIKVLLSMAEGVILANVLDDGDGFDVLTVLTTTESSTGFGLFSIRERLEYLSGKLEIESTPGVGTSVTIHFPVGILIGTESEGEDV